MKRKQYGKHQNGAIINSNWRPSMQRPGGTTLSTTLQTVAPILQSTSRMTLSSHTMPPRRKSSRQTAISDFFASTPPRAPKRRPESPARVDRPVVRRPSPSPSPDAMVIEGPTDPAQELTQEELDVHDQLESLGCSLKRPRSPPPDDTDETPPRGEPSDGDDSDDSLMDMERTAALRRSTRITREVVRYSGEMDRPTGTSVFGGGVFAAGITRAKSSSRDIKRALREVNQKVKQEEHLEEIRKQIEEGGKAGQDETLFQQMADAEERAEQMRQEAQDKFSAPVPLFFRQVVMRPLAKNYYKKGRGGTFPLHPVHDLVVEAIKAGDDADIALSFLAPVVKRYIEIRDIRGLFEVADFLFQLSVFDTSEEVPGRLSRDFLVDVIADIVRADVNPFKTSHPNKRKMLPFFPTVMSVLKDYGAAFDDMSDLRKVGKLEMHEGSLDKQVPISDTADTAETADAAETADIGVKTVGKDDTATPAVAAEFARSERNLGRLFRIAAVQVRCGVPLGLVLTGEKYRVHEGVLLSLGICTRVLLSAFGNRLYHDVGKLIDESLALIDESEWPEFRLKAAAHMHSFTTRLELHVELVTYLLPYTRRRSRCLGLDIAQLSLQQWCSANTPSTICTTPSARAREVGVKAVSFCLTDVVGHMQAIPEITPTTDMVWISLLARMVKVVLSEACVLERRVVGELGALKKVLTRIRVNTRRLGLDVPVQRMRVALDAVERMLQDVARGTERKEVVMAVEEKRQASLVGLRASAGCG